MLLAHGEERSHRDVGHLEVGEHLAYDVAAGLGGGDSLVHVHVEHRTARVAALQLVLHLERLEEVVRITGRQLGAVGVVTVTGSTALDDVREALLVFAGKAVGGAFGGGGLQVVEVAGGLLVAADAFAHEVQHFLSKGNTHGLGGVHGIVGEVAKEYSEEKK